MSLVYPLYSKSEATSESSKLQIKLSKGLCVIFSLTVISAFLRMKQYKHGEGNSSWNVESTEEHLGWLQNEIFGISALCSGKSRKACKCILDSFRSNFPYYF